MENQKKETPLFDLAKAIAPHLDGAWRFHQIESEKHSSDWRAIALISDDEQPGRCLHLSPCYKKPERLSITGTLPAENRMYHQRITVAKTRTGQAIARDINRRLLPGYLQTWQERAETHCERQAKIEAFAHKQHLLEQWLPGFSDHRQHGNASQYRSYFSDEDKGLRGHVDMYVHYEPEQVRLELSLSFDQLIQLAAFLQQS